MKRSGTVKRIRQLSAEGQSMREIAKSMGISRNTVKKYLTIDYSSADESDKRKSKIDEYRSFVDGQVKNGNYNCENILKQIRGMGYEGGLTILKDYVRQYRPGRQLPAVRRYETAPGHQAQLDWGIAHYCDKYGVVHKVPAMVMVLGYSRAMYVEFVKRCDEDSLMRGMANAFEFFGGVPREVLTDRMKTVITDYSEAGPVWHKRFEDFAAVMGFVPRVCRARRPQTKGKVERGVRFLKENFLPCRCFTDLDDLNSQVKQWCSEQNNRIHGSTGKAPSTMLIDEKLMALPSSDMVSAYRWQSRKASRDGFISYDGVLYGLPWQYSGKEISVRIVGDALEAWHGGIRIASHRRERGNRTIVWLEGQYKGMPDTGLSIGSARMAFLVDEHRVETRPLSAYARLMEASHD